MPLPDPSRRMFVASVGLALACPWGLAHASAPAVRSMARPEGQRYWQEFVPARGAEGAPVVMVLHGGGQSMRRIFDRPAGGSARWAGIAAREDILLVAPNGVALRSGDTAGNRQSWNDFDQRATTDVDDVGFLTALVDRVISEHGADRSRVYITGASNGGMMTFRMLLERPDLFAAAAAFISSLPDASLRPPARPTPILIVNGTEDRLVPWGGGALARNRGVVRSTAETVRFFREANGVRAESTVTQLPPAVPPDGCRLILERWDGDAPVALLTMEGGGHEIPDPDTPERPRMAQRILGPACRGVAGAELAWDFMRTFRKLPA